MKTEREFLFEISYALEAISRSTDESRKQEMKKNLHQKLYPLKHRFGFRSIKDVWDSVNYMRAGQPDPTVKQRYNRLKQTIEILNNSLYDFEQMHGLDKLRQAEPRLSLLYNKQKAQDRRPDIDLSRE